MERLFPVTSLNRLILVGGRKFELAQSGDVLIDDWMENIDEWRARGGAAFKWTEWTEDMPEAAKSQIEDLRVFLNSRKGLR